MPTAILSSPRLARREQELQAASRHSPAFSMAGFAFAERELRIAAKSRMALLWRLAGPLALALTVTHFLQKLGYGGPTITGARLFNLLFAFAATGFPLLMIPALWSSFERERSAGTIQMLRLSRTSIMEIVFGKYAGGSLPVWQGFLASIPFLAMPMLWGGVSSEVLARGVLFIASGSFAMGALGLLISSSSRTAGGALAGGFGAALAWTVIPTGSPFDPLINAIRFNFLRGIDLTRGNVQEFATHLVIGVLALAATGWRLKAFDPVTATPAMRTHARRTRVNPWLRFVCEAPENLRRQLLIVTGVCAFVAIVIRFFGASPFTIALHGLDPFAPARLPLLGFMAGTVWSALQQGRSNGVFELLLCMPMAREEIAGRIRNAALARFAPALALIVLLQIALAAPSLDFVKGVLTAGFLVAAHAIAFLSYLLLPLVVRFGAPARRAPFVFAGTLAAAMFLDLFFAPFIVVQTAFVAWALAKFGPNATETLAIGAIRETPP